MKLKIAFFLYLTITATFTFPLILNISDSVIGGGSDGAVNAWSNWYIKYKIFDLRQSPLETNLIYSPQTVNMAVHTINYFGVLATMPLQYFFGPVTAINIYIILGLALTACTAFLLSKSLLKDPRVAFVSGLIFAFNPFITNHLRDGHFALATPWTIPLFVLLLLKAFRTRRLKWPLLAGLVLGLTVYTHYHLFLIELLFMLLFLTYNYQKLLNFESLKKLITIWAAAVTVSIPLLIPLLFAVSKSQLPKPPLQWVRFYSADVLSFITPPSFHYIWGRFFQNTGFNHSEGIVFVGYSLLATLIFLAIKKPKINRLWLFMGATFLIISLGPFLRINGKDYVNIGTTKIGIPLPYLPLTFVPVFGWIKESARFTIMLMLSLSTLSGYSLKILIDRKTKRVAYGIIGLFAATLLLEYWPKPFELTDLTVPSIYRQIAKEPEDFTVLQIPLGWRSGVKGMGIYEGAIQYYQVVHQKRILGGKISRISEKQIFYHTDTPGIKFLVNVEENDPDEVDLSSEKISEVFKDLDIRYIVIHKEYLGGDSTTKTTSYLKKTIHGIELHDDGNVVWAKVP